MLRGSQGFFFILNVFFMCVPVLYSRGQTCVDKGLSLPR